MIFFVVVVSIHSPPTNKKKAMEKNVLSLNLYLSGSKALKLLYHHVNIQMLKIILHSISSKCHYSWVFCQTCRFRPPKISVLLVS